MHDNPRATEEEQELAHEDDLLADEEAMRGPQPDLDEGREEEE